MTALTNVARSGAQRGFASGLTGLNEGEQLIIWSARRWIVGLGGNAPHLWSQVWNSFARHFGATDGKRALRGLSMNMKLIYLHGRRKFRYYPPCCQSLTSDELGYLAFLAVCQKKDWMLARSHANSLLFEEGAEGFLVAGRDLSLVLSRHGYPFSHQAIAAFAN